MSETTALKLQILAGFEPDLSGPLARHRSAFPDGAFFMVDVVPDCIRHDRFPKMFSNYEGRGGEGLEDTCSNQLSYRR